MMLRRLLTAISFARFPLSPALRTASLLHTGYCMLAQAFSMPGFEADIRAERGERIRLQTFIMALEQLIDVLLSYMVCEALGLPTKGHARQWSAAPRLANPKSYEDLREAFARRRSRIERLGWLAAVRVLRIRRDINRNPHGLRQPGAGHSVCRRPAIVSAAALAASRAVLLAFDQPAVAPSRARAPPLGWRTS
jgi:hypothetical protein